MPTRSSLRAAPSTAPVSVVTLLDREVAAIDTLIAELRLGCRDQRHYDALEERAQGIADRIRRAFRRGQR